MNKITKIFLLTLTTCCNAFATVGVGKIDEIIMYSSGSLIIKGVEFKDTQCVNNDGFTISSDHPQLDKLYSFLLTAKTTHNVIRVDTEDSEGCNYAVFTSNPYLTFTIK